MCGEAHAHLVCADAPPLGSRRGTGRRHRLELPGHLGLDAGDAAIQLHARPAEALRRDAVRGQVIPHRVVVGHLAAVLQQHRVAHAPVREVAGERVEIEAGAVGRAAALGVHERDEARHVAPRWRVGVELVGDEARDLA